TSLSFSLSRDVITSRENLRLERRLRPLRELTERVRVRHGQIGEDLAVELDLRLLQPGDHLVVREPVLPRAGVDAHDPEPAERALLRLPVAVGVDERVLDLLLRIPVARVLHHPVALRLLGDLAALLTCVDGSFDARHQCNPSIFLIDLTSPEATDR